ncbi:MAG: hypothetical protein QOF14_1060 [Hyphomicrobiales bacterium]|nr:hypothetical protein [Hyphomicrobiales bacterium]
MKHLSLLIAIIALAIAPPALAQVSPTPTIGATSPLGMTPGSSVAPTGIPMGATALASPGLSPLPCPATGSTSSAMSGSTTTFDGGGIGMGAGMSMPGSLAASGPCGTTSSGASSMAATSPVTPGGATRTGIPLGSFEIGSAGVSPMLPSTSMTSTLPVGAAVPSTPFLIPPSTTPATSFDASAPASSSAGTSSSTLPNGLPTACAGVPGNINTPTVFRGAC